MYPNDRKYMLCLILIFVHSLFQIYEVESKQWKSQWQDVIRTEGPQEDDEDTMVVD